jgi:electron transfer flavoprotein alpha subunit
MGLTSLVDEYHPEILLLSATAQGDDLAPRLAQHLGTGLMSHCVKLEMDMSERLLLGTFPVLGGEMYRTAACPKARPQMATLQPGAFPKPYPDEYRTGQAKEVDVNAHAAQESLTWLSLGVPVELPAVRLASARVVVAGGRGMRDASGFALVEQLAGALAGSVAGSRGAFDEGWIAEEQIVGAGGTTIAPDLYIACGLSGDIYHTYGIQDAAFVVAINSKEDAPIMEKANIAVVGDALEIVPAMLEALEQ